MEARFAFPESTLTAPNYRVENIKFREIFSFKFAYFKTDEIILDIKLENRKKFLNHCNVRYSLKVKNSFVKHAKKKTLKNFKHGKIVMPAFKYTIIEKKEKKRWKKIGKKFFLKRSKKKDRKRKKNPKKVRKEDRKKKKKKDTKKTEKKF